MQMRSPQSCSAIPPRCVHPAALAAVCVAAMLLLAGCGGGDDEDTPDKPTPTVNCNQQPAVCT